MRVGSSLTHTITGLARPTIQAKRVSRSPGWRVQDANSRAGKFFYISQWLQVDLVAAEPIPAPFRGDLSEVQAKLAQSSADYRLIRRLGRDKMRVSLANATESTRP
jgi:hypothetical protein